jgi:hypothetical protein
MYRKDLRRHTPLYDVISKLQHLLRYRVAVRRPRMELVNRREAVHLVATIA